MKISRIYCNYPDKFSPISFNAGLNVIWAEIRFHDHRDKDTHNLGKTTLATLIDFCLIKGKSPDFFLFKHFELFKDFVFFLEVLANDGKYYTIRRPVATHSKISILYHDGHLENAHQVDPSQWNHWLIPIDKAKLLINSILNLDAIAPWPYRMALGYSLRNQRDYGDVFQLDKFRGKHSDWKPFVADLLGFDGDLVSRNYEISEKLEEVNKEERRLTSEAAGIGTDLDKLDGVLLVRQREADRLETELRAYNFIVPEREINSDLVNNIETSIAAFNNRRYHLQMGVSRIVLALEANVSFDLERLVRLFEEAKLVFPDQLTRDFRDLEEFNRAIGEERNFYLRAELDQANEELKQVEIELERYNAVRSDHLAVLRENESFAKYRALSARLVDMKADIANLRRIRDVLIKLMEARKETTRLKLEKEQVVEDILDDIARGNELYKEIRLHFSSILESVINRNAVISTRVNTEGNIEFNADILNDVGGETSEDLGHSFRKLMCIAFDMAVARTYVDSGYIHFLYHDGALETLDDRKKLNLIDVMREYSRLGIQQVITVISSDLPIAQNGQRVNFTADEVVRVLHDGGQEGRLFNMPIW